MPARWLSTPTNVRREEPQPVIQASGGFDFAFTTKTSGSCSHSHPHLLQEPRPLTSGDDRLSKKRKPDLTLLTQRPKTSQDPQRHHVRESPSPPPLLSPQIGLAFGSPRHPPPNFDIFVASMHSTQARSPETSSPVRSPSVRKWKKIGELFRPRSNSHKESSPTQAVNSKPIRDLSKSVSPKHRTRQQNITSSKRNQDVNHDLANRPKDQRHECVVKVNDMYVEDFNKFLSSAPAPSLQVKIPGSPLDRYSVMFKNINSTPQAEVSGQSKSSRGWPNQGSTSAVSGLSAVVPGLKRRVTSPTITKSPEFPRSASQCTSPFRYSLFPSTPSVSRPQSQQRPSPLPLMRPSTAPSPSCSSTAGHPSPPKIASQAAISDLPTQPETSIPDQVPYPDLTSPVNTCEGISHSRGSSAGEIFFEVKSFRGSSGQDVNQYEMTRPPSAEVQLARSKSNARKRLCHLPTADGLPVEEDSRSIKTTSTQIDETIALVESLTSASVVSVNHDDARDFNTRPMEWSPRDEPVAITTSDDTDCADRSESKRQSSQSRLQGLNINVPSPVLESIEEATPVSIEFRVSTAQTPEVAAPLKLHHIASRSRVCSNDQKDQRIQQTTKAPSPPPPAVPVKDSKFIPLSRYAPKHTTEVLEKQTGLRPVRPTRSNTDSNISYNNRFMTSGRHGVTGRSYTMPSMNESRRVQHKTPRPAPLAPERPTRDSREPPLMIAYAKPAAEVSVARTVSLSRRPSAKIMVSRQPSRSTTKPLARPESVVAEKKVSEKLPVLQEVHSRHKPGISQDVVLEMVNAASSKSALPKTSRNQPARTLDVCVESPPIPQAGFI